MKEELKPCPFCGSDKLLLQEGQHYHVSCLNCQAKWGHPHKDVAIKAWNTRSTVTLEWAVKRAVELERAHESNDRNWDFANIDEIFSQIMQELK